MSKNRKGEFVIRCILCGKNFYADTRPDCGETYNGQPICKTTDIKRAMEKRIASVKEKQNDSD